MTAINISFIDFNGKNNHYKEIQFKNNFSLRIKKKNDNVILNYKNGKYNYYLPYEIKLVNNKHIDKFKFLLYYGLLNHINCLINYNGKNKYSCEYFYYNCNTLKDLPSFKLKIGKDEYIIENYDTFNSKIRKRYVIINIPKNENIIFYEEKKLYKNNQPSNQKKLNNKNLNEEELIQINKSE